jgi:hypothetical protein
MCKSRNTPPRVARQLRQEAGFGCVVCGSPIIEYHHIIEWKESRHFDPEHMVVLCPSHHTEYGKLGRQRAYKAKQSPHNIRHGHFKGLLGGNQRHRGMRFGGMEIIGCTTAVSFFGNPILSYSQESGETLVDFYFPKADFWPDIEIASNVATTWIDGFWDIEFKTNWVKFIKSDGSFVHIDFREEFVAVSGNFELGGSRYELNKSSIKIDDTTHHGGRVSDGKVGLTLGGTERILRPNYAMAMPVARRV